MNKKKMIEDTIAKDGYVIGCWDESIEKLPKSQILEIASRADEEYTDVIVKSRNKIYVVEISTVDNEKDFSMLTKAEYIDRYGDEKFED